jgi:hypothetical protein
MELCFAVCVHIVVSCDSSEILKARAGDEYVLRWMWNGSTSGPDIL